MINLSRFSRMSFYELTQLPNYYIHEIYKLFVDDNIARTKREEEEAKKRAAEERKEQRQSGRVVRDSSDVSNLRSMLAGNMSDNDLEDLIEELE